MPGPAGTRILSTRILGLLILGLPIPGIPTLTAAGPAPAQVARPAEEILYQSNDLRIYRSVDRHGAPVVILTNLDAQGNFFPGHRSDAAAVERRSEPSGSPSLAGSPEPASGTAPHPAPAAQVRVVVNRGDGADPADADDVQVEADGRGGTTVIINIHPPAPPERQTVVVPAVAGYPVVAYGGLAGPFRYPEHLHFLGYGHGTSAPSHFGGLGLNAGNRFGLKTGVACDRGFDCMFGPARDHP